METEKELKELRDKNDFVFQRWYAYAAEISSELGTEPSAPRTAQRQVWGKCTPWHIWGILPPQSVHSIPWPYHTRNVFKVIYINYQPLGCLHDVKYYRYNKWLFKQAYSSQGSFFQIWVHSEDCSAIAWSFAERHCSGHKRRHSWSSRDEYVRSPKPTDSRHWIWSLDEKMAIRDEQKRRASNCLTGSK